MSEDKAKDHPPAGTDAHKSTDLIPREFLRVIAIWSLVPAYVLAGAFLGWLVGLWLDRWFYATPYAIAVGLILALGMAVRDMLRLRDTL